MTVISGREPKSLVSKIPCNDRVLISKEVEVSKLMLATLDKELKDLKISNSFTVEGYGWNTDYIELNKTVALKNMQDMYPIDIAENKQSIDIVLSTIKESRTRRDGENARKF